VTKSPLTGTVTDSHHGGWSGARLKWAGLDGLLLDGESDEPVYLLVEDGDVEVRDASHLGAGRPRHDRPDRIGEEVDGKVGRNVSVMAIGQGGENEVRYGCVINERRPRVGPRRHGCRDGLEEREGGRREERHRHAEARRSGDVPGGLPAGDGEVIRESDVTAPNEGGLSMYGTNVLMNATEEMDGLPAKNAKYTSTEAYRDAEGVDTDAERVSGENVRENILVDEPTSLLSGRVRKRSRSTSPTRAMR